MKILAIALSAIITLSGCQTTGVIPKTDITMKRNIPLSLFTGMAEGEEQAVHHPSGDPDISLKKVQWKNPETGIVQSAYKRERYSGREKRNVTQYFVPREDGQGIGRAWDSRYTSPNSAMSGNIKFPLGIWYQGEKRTLQTSGKPMTITILDINYGGNGGIRFSWSAYGTCWEYSYLPRQGMTKAVRNANSCS
jgi:hypothetical protein